MKMIACFGELLLRLTAPGRELLLQRPHLDVHHGGAEANVAVALAHLGHRTRMISRVPDNVLGRAAVAELRRHGVDEGGVLVGPGRMGLYFLSAGAGFRPSEIVYDREGSSFALAGSQDFDWDRLLDGADLLHLSGITPALGPCSAELAVAAADAAAARGLQISFDGNYRAQLWQRWDSDPRTILRALVSRADLLFGNHRDISLLLGEPFGGDGADRRRAAAEAAFAAFPKLQVIASTARHVVDSERHRLAASVDRRDGAAQTDEVEITGIVDRIGTGDAFAAGVLHGLMLERDLEWTARAGLALACLKHGLPGDVSLFGPDEIAAFMSGAVEDVRR